VVSEKYQRPFAITGIVSGVAAILIQLFIRAPWKISIVSPIVMGIIIAVCVVTTLIYFIYQIKFYTLRTKLLMALLTVSLVAAATIALVTNLTTRQVLTNSVGDQLKSISESQALSVGDFLSSNLGLIKVLAISPSLRKSIIDSNMAYPNEMDEINAQIEKLDQQWSAANKANNIDDPFIQSRVNNLAAQELKTFQQLNSNYIEILITDINGGLVASTNLTPKYNQKNEEWWQDAYNLGRGYIYISSPEFNGQSKIFTLQFALPIYNTETQLISGILHSTLRLNELIANLSEKSSTGSEVQIVFRGVEPKVIKKSQLMPMDWTNLDALDKITAKPYAELLLDGIQSLVSVTEVKTNPNEPSIDQLGYWIVTNQQSDQALKPVRAQTDIISILALVICGLVVGAALLMGNSLARPITRLTQVAEQVYAGDLTAQSKLHSQDEIGKLSSTLDSITNRLHETLDGLEQRIAERTRIIEASAEVSRRLSTILDRNQLVLAVVEEVQRAFNYYHAHIYLYDDARENLVLVGGTGEAGQAMLSQGHKISKGKGIVGRTAENNQVILVPDTGVDPAWLPNPLLPDTKSELAVPIASGARVWGVLDVQHNVVNGLSQQDADLLQSIANQVAVAVQNSVLFSKIQHKAELETLVNTISQKIQTTTTVEGILQVLARELTSALHAQRATVQFTKLTQTTNDSKLE